MGYQARKRAFSKAFQPGPLNEVYRRAIRKISGSSLLSPFALSAQASHTPATNFVTDTDIENQNQNPSSKGQARAVESSEASQLGVPEFGFDFDFDFDASLTGNPNIQDSESNPTTGTAGSHVIVEPTDAPLPSMADHLFHFSANKEGQAYSDTYDSTALKSVTDTTSSPPSGPVLGACFNPDFAIHEDSENSDEPVFTVPHQASNTGALTPTALNFQDLSLFDGPDWSQINTLSNARPIANRTSYYTLESALFKKHVPDLQSTDIIISFGKGKQHLAIRKHIICASSPYFAKLLNVEYPPTHTQLLRLRDDFPPAIPATLHFLTHGSYPFDSTTLLRYPALSLPDLHIHTYLVAQKYNIPTLHSHALTQYIDFAHIILTYGFVWPTTLPFHPYTCTGNILLPSLLHSFVLLWRNTPNRHDALRSAVLDCLVKPWLSSWVKVEYFVDLLECLAGFSPDLCASLAEDGLRVGSQSIE
ncbi:hypothetical protein IAQ61_006971 [Plenodomus lingam]|uniref:uncharacterized protein n=1 Tax=Leptosphaeria maculans TaxID=5022 RepID=UPI00331E4E58|nr:hypothetical protein IAQ61_006971 [Plenodomus lingam]